VLAGHPHPLEKCDPLRRSAVELWLSCDDAYHTVRTSLPGTVKAREHRRTTRLLSQKHVPDDNRKAIPQYSGLLC